MRNEKISLERREYYFQRLYLYHHHLKIVDKLKYVEKLETSESFEKARIIEVFRKKQNQKARMFKSRVFYYLLPVYIYRGSFMSDGSIFCTDQRDVFLRNNMFTINSRFQHKVFVSKHSTLLKYPVDLGKINYRRSSKVTLYKLFNFLRQVSADVLVGFHKRVPCLPI